MVLAYVFSAAVGVMLVLLYICWRSYWSYVRGIRDVSIFLQCAGFHLLGARGRLYALLERYDAQKEAWYTRYHWCLFLTPIFLAMAKFCAILHWTGGWLPWVNIPLSALVGVLALLIGWWLGYGPVREYVLPLEDYVLKKKE